MTAQPLARLVYLDAPMGESELEFYKRKAQERSQEITRLNRQLLNLRDGLEEALAENVRLHGELNS